MSSIQNYIGKKQLKVIKNRIAKSLEYQINKKGNQEIVKFKSIFYKWKKNFLKANMAKSLLVLIRFFKRYISRMRFKNMIKELYKKKIILELKATAKMKRKYKK